MNAAGVGVAAVKELLAEMAEGGSIMKPGSANAGKIKGWQANNQPTDDLNVKKVANPAKSPYRLHGWDGFAAGGRVQDMYKNGEVPMSEMKKVKGYAGWGQAGEGLLHKSVADKFQSMLDAAKADGHPIGINDTFRTFADQQYLYDTKPRGTAAVPGTSNHGYGLAADLNYHDAGYKWLWANADKFGFTYLKGWGLSPNTPNATEGCHWENLNGAGTASPNVKTDPAGDASDKSTPPSDSSGDTAGDKEETTVQKTPMEQLTGALDNLVKALGMIAGANVNVNASLDDAEVNTPQVNPENITPTEEQEKHLESNASALEEKALKTSEEEMEPGIVPVVVTNTVTQPVINNVSSGKAFPVFSKPSPLIGSNL